MSTNAKNHYVNDLPTERKTIAGLYYTEYAKFQRMKKTKNEQIEKLEKILQCILKSNATVQEECPTLARK